MASSTSGSGDVSVVISRACAEELLYALSLALGTTPIKKNTKGKKKGKGGGGKDTSGGKSSTKK